MVYVICVSIFLGLILLAAMSSLAGKFNVDFLWCSKMSDGVFNIILLLWIASGLLSIFWSIFGGYKYITKPQYNYELYAEVCILETDSYLPDDNKHDIARMDKDNYIIYVDSSTYKEKEVVICDSTEAKLEVYRCIPKNNFNSADVFFNRTYSYKVYVPENYKVEFRFLK